MRRSRVGRVAWAAAAIVLFLSSVAPFASEPDGFSAIRYEWVTDPPSPGTEAALRISVRAVVPIEDVVASFEAPAGVTLRADGNAPLAESGATSFGALGAGVTTVFEVIVRCPESGGGIVAFRVKGVRNGTPFEEGFGLPIGQVGVEPVLRDGALEFPSETTEPKNP